MMGETIQSKCLKLMKAIELEIKHHGIQTHLFFSSMLFPGFGGLFTIFDPMRSERLSSDQ